MKENKLKVGIITFHRGDNYGAVLQTAALRAKAAEYAGDARVIDYRCSAIEDFYKGNYFPRPKKNILLWMKQVINWRKKDKTFKEKKEKFEKFRELFNMSESVSGDSDRSRVESEYDVILTGSDQIWNERITKGFDPFYCFVRCGSNKSLVLASYAASLGSVSSFENCSGKYREAIMAYDYVSVRESDALEYLREKYRDDVCKTIDPTLLVEPDFWSTMAPGTQRKKYLFYYDVAKNDTAKGIALKLAKENKLELIHFCDDIMPCRKRKLVTDAGPVDFLNLIRSAEMVVTSSFHATVFSIVFKKRFVTVAHPVTGSRVRTLLGDVGLEECLYNGDLEKNMSFRPDYEKVFSKLSLLRKSSEAYLEKVFKDAENRKNNSGYSGKLTEEKC